MSWLRQSDVLMSTREHLAFTIDGGVVDIADGETLLVLSRVSYCQYVAFACCASKLIHLVCLSTSPAFISEPYRLL